MAFLVSISLHQLHVATLPKLPVELEASRIKDMGLALASWGSDLGQGCLSVAPKYQSSLVWWLVVEEEPWPSSRLIRKKDEARGPVGVDFSVREESKLPKLGGRLYPTIKRSTLIE